jgi:hypothetical protein
VSSAQGDYFVFNQEVIMTGKLSKYLLALAGCQELILGSLREISPHYRVHIGFRLRFISYAVGTAGSFPRQVWPECESYV